MVHCYCNLLILLIAAGKGAVAPAVRKEAMKTPYQAILTTEPGKRGGKPCIRGMRITVYDVLSYLAAGMTHDEILADFPYLTEQDIRACLSYAADPDGAAGLAAEAPRRERQRLPSDG